LAKPLHLFYEEPDPDRWVVGDRFPRRWIRRLVRGPRRPGGQERVFLNLRAGLDRLGLPYTVNRYAEALRNPTMPVGIVGKSHVLDLVPWKNPILFGSSIMSHPLADENLLQRLPTIQRILVPGEWMRAMCEPYWGNRVQAWPVGIDTQVWAPASAGLREFDVLIYDKIHWEYDSHRLTLLDPIRSHLRKHGLRVAEIRYGFYKEQHFASLLKRCRTMIYLGEHETQGIAYQQTLSCGVPILVWDRGGCWRDPQYYPARVQFSPVTTVPYWDERCGLKFASGLDFAEAFDRFWDLAASSRFRPRDYIMENLTLEKCALHYVDHWRNTFGKSA